MKYTVKYTSQFKRDLKAAKKKNKDLNKLYESIEVLANGDKLDSSYRDHELKGKYKGVRERHIEADWLLIYEYIEDVLVLSLARLGSHSELFN